MKRAAVLASAVLAALALAQANKVTGTWKGSLQVTVPDEMKSQMPPASQLPKLEITLKGDGTYNGTTTQPSSQGKATTKTEGAWKLQGQNLTLTPKKRDGKPATGEGAKPRVYKLSQDGKTLTLDLTNEMRQSPQAKNQKGMDKATMKVVLKRV
jgi:hypothetical protein